MDFDLTDEQRLLKDSVNRLIDDRYGDFEHRKAYHAEPAGWSRTVWEEYASLGLTALLLNEDVGGIGGGPVETMIVMEAMGRGLTLEPYLSTAILGAVALKAASPWIAATVTPSVAEGRSILALAQAEPQSRFHLEDVKTAAREQSGQYILDGRKTLVMHGDCADRLVVSARTAGSQWDRDGITLFLVDAKTPGIAIHANPSQDGRTLADISFSGVAVGADAVLGERNQGYVLLSEIVDTGIAALAAEAVGAMEKLQALTVDYLKTRKQFGVAIGSFQVLQHRAVDMMIALEQARSMAYYATTMLAAQANERSAAMSAVKIQINRSARHIGQEAIQLHGGIGVTLEYQASHYFKRLTAIENMFGDTDYHSARLRENSNQFSLLTS